MLNKKITEKYCGTIAGTRGYEGIIKLVDCPQDIISIQEGVPIKIGFSLNFTQDFTLQSFTNEYNQAFIKLKEINSNEEVAPLKEKGIFIDESFINYKNEKYFVEDIIGCNVFTKQRKFIGEVTDVLILPANDVWEISNKKQKIMLPVIDKTIISIDLKKMKIVVELLEGLEDL